MILASQSGQGALHAHQYHPVPHAVRQREGPGCRLLALKVWFLAMYDDSVQRWHIAGGWRKGAQTPQLYLVNAMLTGLLKAMAMAKPLPLKVLRYLMQVAN